MLVILENIFVVTMIALTVFLFVASGFAGALPQPGASASLYGGRIVGGEPADIKDLPYQLSIRYNDAHFCGGSIISANWAVSAAHCFGRVQSSSVLIIAGTTFRKAEGSQHRVKEIIRHSSYNPSTHDNDIAVLQVVQAFPLGKPGIQAIPLASASPPDDAEAVVSGWGEMRPKVKLPGWEDVQAKHPSMPDHLQKVVVPIVNQAKCNEAYGGDITQNMICAGLLGKGGKDSCQGDSGGPMVVNNQLVGIVSFGEGCARAQYPGVYARVDKLRQWIQQTTGV